MLNSKISKIISFIGINSLAIMSGEPKVIPVAIIMSLLVALEPEQDPKTRLIRQCMKTLHMNYYEAKCYAENITKAVKKEIDK